MGIDGLHRSGGGGGGPVGDLCRELDGLGGQVGCNSFEDRRGFVFVTIELLQSCDGGIVFGRPLRQDSLGGLRQGFALIRRILFGRLLDHFFAYFRRFFHLGGRRIRCLQACGLGFAELFAFGLHFESGGSG